jgi:hypothetical protein
MSDEEYTAAVIADFAFVSQLQEKIAQLQADLHESKKAEHQTFMDAAKINAAIERKDAALRMARDGVAVLGDTCKHLGLQLGQDKAAKLIAAIDAALEG